jgi:hypothetical protein
MIVIKKVTSYYHPHPDLPPSRGGNWGALQTFPSPRGRGLGEGDKKGNSYTINLKGERSMAEEASQNSTRSPLS